MKLVASLVAATLSLSAFAGTAFAQDAVPPPPLGMEPPPPVMMVAPPPPADFARPSSGLGLIIAGSIVGGLGVVNLATSVPICNAELSNLSSSTRRTCVIASMSISGAMTGIGVGLLIAGLNQRSKFQEWQQNHPVAAGLSFQPVAGGGGLGFRTAF